MTHPSGVRKFGEVLRGERGRLRPGGGRPHRVSRDAGEPQAAGLALSGGGIRSAAFALGVLQALEAEGCFARLDYLSTVSGGGYIGTALIAALHRDDNKFPFSTNVGDDLEPADIADNVAVAAIRDRVRYLMPNGPFDLVVSFGIILRGLVVSAINVSWVIFLTAALMLALNPDEAGLRRSSLPRLLGAWSLDLEGAVEARLGQWFVGTKLLAVVLVLLLTTAAIARSSSDSTGRSSDRSQNDPGSRLSIATGRLLILMGVVFVVEAQAPIMATVVDLFGRPDASSWEWRQLGYYFAAAVAASGLVGVTWKLVLHGIKEAEAAATRAAAAKAMAGRLTLVASAAVLPTLLYVAFLWLVYVGMGRDAGPEKSPALLGWVPFLGSPWTILAPQFLIVAIHLVQRCVGPLPSTVWSRAWWRRCAFRTSAWWAAVAFVAGLLGCAIIFHLWLAPGLSTVRIVPEVAWRYAGLASLLGLASALFSENANSLHRLYRDRLEQAFSISGRDGGPLRMSSLRSTADGRSPVKPQLIVNATVNLKASKRNRRGRNADFFVFTPDDVGSDATGYVGTSEFEEAQPHFDLATAAAISGAAVSSAMGRVGAGVLAPTLTLLNIRLGFWLRNPAFAGTTEARESAGKSDRLALSYAISEAFGRLRETTPKVYVTDGGHIDNLGLHQLLKRRCDYVVVADAEADPGMVFGSFVDVEQFARTDLGVRIELPLAPLREAALLRRASLRADSRIAAHSPPTAHAAIGRILYPRTSGADPLAAKEGVLLYVKASVTGDERSYVLDYERRHPRFPHEPTSDQFFGERQFEAYRALGFHATTGALTYSDGSSRWGDLLTRLRGGLKS